MYMVSAPKSFPATFQACSQYITNNCYSPTDFGFTLTSVTDSFGYARFQISSSIRYQGIFRFVLTIGSIGQSGSNFFSQVFEIVFTSSLKQAFDCTSAQSLLSSAQRLAPAVKYYNACSFRNPDASCKWNFTVCDFGYPNMVWRSSKALPLCLPLAKNIRDPLTVYVVNDHNESVYYQTLVVLGAGSSMPQMHLAQTFQSDSNGLAVLDNYTVDFALKGPISFMVQLPPFQSSYQNIPLSQQVLTSGMSAIDDEVHADFLTPPPSVVISGRTIGPALQVRIKVKSKCLSYPGELGIGWVPPKLEVRFVSSYEANGSVLLLVNQSVSIASNSTDPVVEPLRGAAVATFANLSVQSGIPGRFKLQIVLHSSKQVLLTSQLVSLLTTANALRILDHFPSVISPHLSLQLRVQVNSLSGTPLANAFVYAEVIPYSNENQHSQASTLNGSNVSALLNLNSSLSVSDTDGICHFLLTFQSYTPGRFVLAFSSQGVEKIFSSPFSFQSPIAEMKFLSKPLISSVFPEVWVWPQIKSNRIHVGFNTHARAGPIFNLPSSMKDVVKGKRLSGSTNLLTWILQVLFLQIRGL